MHRLARTFRTILLTATAVALVAGCGGSSGSGSGGSSSSGSTKSTATSTHAAGAGGATTAQPLTGDATSAGTGDVPDNVNFLTYSSTRPAFSIKYPEGWAQAAAPDGVSFQDKNNLVRVKITSGPAPTVASVTADLAALAKTSPGLHATAAKLVKVRGADVVRAGYTTQSAPNPVTDKRVTLIVDRYVFAKGGKVATIDLGTPRGVDNVDAFRLMSASFTWK